jgi:outer membrane protein OmpA-like peptidoglycan-associated protein
MNKTSGSWIFEATLRVALAGFVSIAGAAAAQEAAPAGDRGPVARSGWYVAPLLTYMKPDSGRCGMDAGPGISAVLGHRGDFASLELWGQFLTLSHGECNYTLPDDADMDSNREPVTEPAGDTEFNGGGLALVLGPFFEDRILQRFFGIVGFGVIRRTDHPQYQQDDSTIFGDAGLGYLQPFSLFGLETAARLEARYRYDVQQPPHPDEQDPAPQHFYNDIIVNLGLQFALSPKPEEPAPTPEPVAVVEAQETDADVDGVPDSRDKCPDTPIGKQVDATGCEPAAPTIETAKAGDTIILHGVNFETARATLTTNAKTILDQVAEKLVARPELKIEIGGHTDWRGSDLYNQTLSEQRAQSVMAYLTEHGVGAERLTAVGYGEAQPVDTNETSEGLERNRRVELKVLEATAAAPAP